MKKSISRSIIAALLCSAPVVAFAAPVTSMFDLSLGGFVKLDYAYNSVNFGQSGGLTPGSGAIAKKTSAAGYQEQSIFTARQSRLWFKASGPEFMGAKTNSLIEGDFYGDASAAAESPQFRMRLAYGSLDWPETQVLFGQNWDIFGPMVASTVDFRSGATTGAPNNPRVPQIRLTQKLNIDKDTTISFVLGVQDPNQDGNNNQTFTANTGTGAVTAGVANTGTGAVSTTAPTNYGTAVNSAGQIMFSSKALGTSPGYFGLPMKPLTLGVFGLYGNSKMATGAAANHTVDSYGYGFYTFIPVLKSSDGKSRAMTMSVEAQVYQAANMAFNTATAATVFDAKAAMPNAAKGYGLGAQAIFYPTQELGITAGFGRRGAIDYDHYTGTDFQKATTQFYGNTSYDLNAAVRVMAEYQYLETLYGKPAAGTHNLGSANVIRLAAFYFF
jgi:hypothetical protein